MQVERRRSAGQDRCWGFYAGTVHWGIVVLEGTEGPDDARGAGVDVKGMLGKKKRLHCPWITMGTKNRCTGQGCGSVEEHLPS